MQFKPNDRLATMLFTVTSKSPFTMLNNTLHQMRCYAGVQRTVFEVGHDIDSGLKVCMHMLDQGMGPRLRGGDELQFHHSMRFNTYADHH